jgi:branched-chain amino acid transport system ATP-binding protein
VLTGTRVAIIGPNGAGKTTLLSIITGVHQPTTGRVLLFGQDVTRLPAHRRLKMGLGCSFQLNRLFFGLNVLENVTLALLGPRSWADKTFRASGTVQHDAQRLLEPMGLWDKRHELVGALSYGDQRKLEIVFGLASHPRLLVLDEPTAGLALAEIGPFMESIKNLAHDTTIIFTSHDMDVVFGLAQYLIVLFFGQVVAQGTPDEIQRNPKVREIYLGEQRS